MGDSRRMVGRQYVQYPERLCLVRLVGFASSRALDRQYVETPFQSMDTSLHFILIDI